MTAALGVAELLSVFGVSVPGLRDDPRADAAQQCGDDEPVVPRG